MAVQDEVPKSRLTLTYRTEINGEEEVVNLPFRVLILGDLSKGLSKDRQVDLEERRIRNLDGNNLNAVMKDMGITLRFTVENKVDPDKSSDMEVEIPIEGMHSFSPDYIAKAVPKLRSLLTLKKLLQEVQANLSNIKEFRKLLNDLYANEEAFRKLLEELKGFESLKLPKREKKSE